MKKDKTFWILLLFVISLVFFLTACYCLEPDYFWHIKAGEYMINNHLLREDVFSWFVSGKYWMSHEWLFELLIYGLKCIFGNYHILIYCFLCLLGLFSITFFSNYKGLSKNVFFSLLFLAFYAIMFIFCVQARPHMISLCLLATTVWFLVDLSHNEDSKKIYFLPLISVLWANFHGGSSNLVYLLCFLFFFAGLFSFQFKKIEAKRFSKKQLIKYLIAMFLCMIGVCINLHGFKMLLYPYQNMLDKTMIFGIQEWQSTSLNVGHHYFYFCFIVFIMFTFLFSDRKIQFIDLLLTGFVVYLGLKSVRFWTFGPVVLSMIIFDYVDDRKVGRVTYRGIIIVSFFLFIFLLFGFPNLISEKNYVDLNSEVISILKEEKPERLFNMYDYGGELIYHDIPVFIDGRADLYSPYNLEDYFNISRLRKDSILLIQKYDFDYFLVGDWAPIYTYLKNNSQYEVIYSKDNIYLFKKIVNHND